MHTRRTNSASAALVAGAHARARFSWAVRDIRTAALADLTQRYPDHAAALVGLSFTYSWSAWLSANAIEAGVEAFLAFVERRDVTAPSRAAACAHVLLHGRRASQDCGRPWTAPGCRLPRSDHLTLWRTSGGGHVLVSQPYAGGLAYAPDTRDAIARWAERWQLGASFEAGPAWHNAECRLVEVYREAREAP